MKTPKTFRSEGISTHVIPVFHDWTAADVWRLIRPNLYETKGGKIKMKPLERQPDGEPRGYTAILLAHGKHYYSADDSGDNDCDCDLSDTVCEHWIRISD